MYKIGEFSLLNKVTIKTLRYYNEIGLFIPKVIDKYTGYRYYDEDQLEEFNKISKYKELGFSLEDIKKLKNNNDESIINKQIEELTLQGKDIDNKLSILKNMIRGDSMNVSFKPYREKYKIGKRVILKNREDLENRLIEVKNILDKNNIKWCETQDIEEHMNKLDILYMTRVQRERFFNEEDYIRLKDSFILDKKKMSMAKDDMLVLHPLPRVNEISVEVDKDPRAAYFKQVQYGVYVRMALILRLLEVEV